MASVLVRPSTAVAQKTGATYEMENITAPLEIAAPMQIDLDQLRNGAVGSPDETDGSPNWVNGNVGSQQGHLEESWSIPYRARIENIA